jgi:hypothetical protein
MDRATATLAMRHPGWGESGESLTNHAPSHNTFDFLALHAGSGIADGPFLTLFLKEVRCVIGLAAFLSVWPWRPVPLQLRGRDEGANQIDIVASDFEGNQVTTTLFVVRGDA